MALLDAEELWGIDVKGYLHIPAALSTAELQLLEKLPPLKLEAVLAENEALQRCLSIVGGTSVRQSWQPRDPPPPRPATIDVPWHTAVPSATGLARKPGRSFHHQAAPGQIFTHGLVTIVATCPSRDIALVPASHHSTVAAPPALVAGQDELTAHGEAVLVRPALKAGDLLVILSATLHGILGSGAGLLRAEYICEQAARTGEVGGEDTWTNGLSPEVRAVLQLEDSDGEGVPVLLTDETGATVLAPREADDAEPSSNYHRGLWDGMADVHCDANDVVNAAEFFYFDLTGYLVVRGLGSPELIAAANAAVDACAHLVTGGDQEATQYAGGSNKLVGRTRMDIVGLLNLPPPHCDPFREMVVHPGVVSRLLWLEGAGFKANNGSCIVSGQGCAGQTLHGNPFVAPSRNYAEYWQRNGRMHTGSVNVAWSLISVTPEDGGFVVVPGSHKASMDMPDTDPADPTNHKGVVHPLMEPGDVIFFMGGATAHGAWATHTDKPRRVALFNYLSKEVHYFTRPVPAL